MPPDRQPVKLPGRISRAISRDVYNVAVPGHVEILRDFPSPEGFPRTVRVYTPEAYDREPSRRFPVLYMQDGQNVFDHPASALADTWHADRVMETLARAGRTEPWIIVGIDSGPGRFHEYSPWDEPRAEVRARGEAYASFFVETLRPYLTKQYRMRVDAASTAVAGSSLGGLISLYLGWRHPDVFGRVGAFSPTVMWSQGLLRTNWKEPPPSPLRIYLDAGEEERLQLPGFPLDYGQAVREFGLHLLSVGHATDAVRIVLEPGGRHHELDWRRRLPEALAWLLAPDWPGATASAPG